MHWDERYESAGASGVSWFEDVPSMSLEMLEVLAVAPDDAVLDVGGGASRLVDYLLERGHTRVGVLDVSGVALSVARRRVSAPERVEWMERDVLRWRPQRVWSVWHDRAVLHFLVHETDQVAYFRVLRAALIADGAFVIGVFAEDGPIECSGLPVRRYSTEDLRRAVAEIGDVEVVSERRQVHHTPSGSSQVFNWMAGRVRGQSARDRRSGE